MKPRLLDLFCGAGGCARGYVEAGFEVYGVDNRPMPRYLHSGATSFTQADALEYLAEHGHEFDVIHASPPCQRYSAATKSRPGRFDDHPDLVPPVRELLVSIGVPYVIENVMGAPMQGWPLMLCGSMFGLLVRRHRLFESSALMLSPGGCRHGEYVGDYPCGRSSRSPRAGERSRVVHVYGHGGSRGDRDLWSRAMGIDWMTMKEMAQAIPPAYTRFIGKHLMEAIHDPGPQ